MKFSVLFALMALAPVAHAADKMAPYVGASFGTTSADYSSARCGSDFGVPCQTTENDTGFSVAAGLRLTQSIAIEAGYSQLGEVQADFASVAGIASFKTTALTLELVGTWLPPDSIMFFSGDFGAYRSDTKMTVTGVGGSASESRTTNDITFGAAVGLNITPAFSAKAQYQRFEGVAANQGDGVTIDCLSLGVAYTFR